MNRLTKVSYCLLITPVLLFGPALAAGGNIPWPDWLLPLAVLVCPPLGLFLAVLGLRHEKRRSSVSHRPPRRAPAALAISRGCIEVVLLLLFFAQHDRVSPIAVNESSAVGSLRTLALSATSYAKAHPEVGFPPDLRSFVVPQGNSVSPSQIDEAIAKGQKKGFRFVYSVERDVKSGKFEHYRINADPLTEGTTGWRHFFVDETGVIRWESEKPASSSSQTLQ
jgi:hypothetical protein